MSSDPAPLVSVVVATRNRAAGLRLLLEALCGQTLSPEKFEVAVVDDASADDTPRVLDEVAALPLRLTALRRERNEGAAAGRNAGWRQAQGSVIAFTDDDCQPSPRWLEEGLASMQRQPAVLVGATQPHPDQVELINPLSRTMRVDEARFAPACNVFYERTDLEAVDGFDEGFELLGGEDTDLAWRVHEQRGRELRFCKEALVYHDVRRRTFAQAVRETYRWEGIARVVARHRNLARRSWHRGYFMRTSHPRAILAAAGLASALAFPPALILAAPWIRYKVFRGRPRLGWLKRLWFAPAMLAIDLFEVAVLVRGSVRCRALIL